MPSVWQGRASLPHFSEVQEPLKALFKAGDEIMSYMGKRITANIDIIWRYVRFWSHHAILWTKFANMYVS